MNARERVVNTFNHVKPDRVPILDHVRHVQLIEFLTGRTLDSTPFEVTAEAYKRLGIDMCAWMFIPQYGIYEGDGGGYSLEGFKAQHQGYEHWIVERPFATLDEAVKWRPRYDLQTLEREVVDPIEYQQGLLGESTVVIGRSRGFLLSTYLALDWENFAVMMYKYPDELHKILDIFAERIIQIAGILGSKTSVPAFLYVADIAGNRGPLFSPAWLKASYFPRLERIVKAFKDKGIKFIYHCDGNVMPLLDELMEIGIDGLHPLDPMGGMSLRKVREKVGNRLVLFGNANINFPHWTPSDVEQEVRRCIEEGGSEGSYFLSLAVGVSRHEVPIENIIAFYGAVERYGRYAEWDDVKTDDTPPTGAGGAEP